MSAIRQRGSGPITGSENLILTPSKLRLHSYVFGPYVTCLWLPNALTAILLLLKIAYAVPLTWWVVLLPQWVGHGGHLLLAVGVLLNADKLIQQQLGPAPPVRASPGMMMQYSSMFSDRRATLIVDQISGLIETTAGVTIKAMLCKALTENTLSSPDFSWRMLLLPGWIAWFVTFAIAMWKPRKERTLGNTRDLLFILLLFVALKLDGIAAYSWGIVFLIPWMWFGALFLGAIVTACVIAVAYACMDLRELALPGGFLLLLLSAASQLPFFIYLCNYLEGDDAITLQQMLLPQIASWFAMWVSGLIICYGLRKKEQLRAGLAASGQVWTAHESAARQLMRLELEDMQQQVDKMSDEELAQVAMRMMAGKAQPQQLLRVGTTLYRRAMSFTASSPKGTGTMSVIRQIDGDGTAQLSDLMSTTAMEEGRAWPATALPSQTNLEAAAAELAGDVCVSVQVVLRSPPAAARAVAMAADSSSDKQQQLGQLGTVLETASPKGGVQICAPEAAAAAAVVAGVGSTPNGCDADDGLCTICYDHQASCVFMECGHGGYCWRCAHVLFARPPSECPVCRQPIQQVIELENPAEATVGNTVRVKVKVPAAPAPKSSRSWFKG